MKTSSAILAFLVTGTLGGVLALTPLPRSEGQCLPFEDPLQYEAR